MILPPPTQEKPPIAEALQQAHAWFVFYPESAVERRVFIRDPVTGVDTRPQETLYGATFGHTSRTPSAVYTRGEIDSVHPGLAEVLQLETAGSRSLLHQILGVQVLTALNYLNGEWLLELPEHAQATSDYRDLKLTDLEAAAHHAEGLALQAVSFTCDGRAMEDTLYKYDRRKCPIYKFRVRTVIKAAWLDQHYPGWRNRLESCELAGVEAQDIGAHVFQVGPLYANRKDTAHYATQLGRELV